MKESIVLIIILSLLVEQVKASCSICSGDDSRNYRVGNPNALIDRGGEPTVTCHEMERIGFQGGLSQDECLLMSSLVHDICDCHRRRRRR
mmetsp:Transcript_16464/g.25126  ORF Transcript_16464/g.25126 Transcript_16464/m.25126 type:complete len:90 (+) Transcript_16464:65-334(+)